jgi:nucleotide-binding universal stress UspA family protein
MPPMAADERADGDLEPPRYHRILVALDDSPAAMIAFRRAVGIARDQRALLTLLTVVPTPPNRVAAAGIAE